MSQQVAEKRSLQDLIHQLQSSKGISANKKVHLLTPIIKAFNDYTKETKDVESDHLPSQILIPCCLFAVPRTFAQILKIKEDEPLDLIPEKKSVQILIESYLKSMLKLLENSDSQIKHVIIEGMAKSILLTFPFPKISRKWVKELIEIWSREYSNINLSLRAFIAINKFLGVASEELYMWALRRMYVSYFEHSKQVSWRNLEHVNFMINCFCEICKINEGRAYYVLFGYIRSIALQMTKANKAKRKEKVEITEKLYSNQILNCFKLFNAVVSRVQSEELTALIYPLIEMSIAYEKVSQATQYLPLKLHIVDQLLGLMDSTGVFVPPVLEILENLLKMKMFLKKMPKKAEKVEGSLELSYKLSPSDLNNTNLINDMFENIIQKVYWLISLSSKLAGGSEIIKRINNFFKKLEYPFSGYKTHVREVIKATKQDSYIHYQSRSKLQCAITDEKSVNTVEKTLKKEQFLSTEKFNSMRQEREDLLKKKLLAENEEEQGRHDEQDDELEENEDELQSGESGWQEASSGASEFVEEAEVSDEDEEEQQNISYEGDPEDFEQHIRQWSEEEWSSQNQL